MKRIEIKIDDEKYEKFVEYKRKNSTNFNAIINAKIDEILESKVSDFLDDKSENKKDHLIKIKLTTSEFNLLKNLARSHGFNSIAKEARFRILNTIYKNPFFTNIEMKELSNATTELENISTHLKAFVLTLKEKKPSEFSLNFSKFENYFKDILAKTDEMKEKITNEYKKVYYRILH